MCIEKFRDDASWGNYCFVFIILSIFLQANPYAFLPAHSKLLGRQLMRISLPGLSSLDQMYLVALADTVAHTKMDFADRFQQDDIKEANGMT